MNFLQNTPHVDETHLEGCSSALSISFQWPGLPDKAEGRGEYYSGFHFLDQGILADSIIPFSVPKQYSSA
jgi:hypothetical protein